MDTIYNYVKQTPTRITDEEYTAVGLSFTLGTHKRAFLASSFVLTRTSGGAPLTRGTDYELDEKDIFYSAAAYEGEDVYTKVNILNATYETGALFVTYDAVFTYATTQAIRSTGLPAGVIVAYASTVAPSGYLLCDGAAISRTTYADLFAAVSTTWGVGDGTATFNLPDGRGGVLRGTGTGTVNARDKVGPAVGAKQEDQMQGHQHLSPSLYWPGYRDINTHVNYVRQDTMGSYQRVGITASSTTTPDRARTDEYHADGTNGTPRTGLESRAYGIGVSWIIKT